MSHRVQNSFASGAAQVPEVAARSRGHMPGFTLVELLVVIAIIAVLISLIVPSLAKAKRLSRRALCMSNYRQFGVAYSSYANDSKGFIAALTGGDERTTLPNLSRWSQCAIQAMKIIRTKDGRGADQAVPLPQFADANPGVMIFEQFSYLPLVAYFGDKLRSPVFACPEDRARLSWQRAPLEMDTSAFAPKKKINSDNLLWWPYSSSYQLMATSIGWDRIPNRTANGGINLYRQGDTHDTYHFDIKPGTSPASPADAQPRIGGRKIDEVRFTSQKVAVADTQQRHEGRDLFFAYPQARQPLLFWDGSASVRTTSDSNQGWAPQHPIYNWLATTMRYEPDLGFESPSVGKSDATTKPLMGFYRWTREGLLGVDFGGAEFSTN